jgi:hypothetical protein
MVPFNFGGIVNNRHDFTSSAPVIAPVMAQCGAEFPEFLPMPSPGQTCRYSGLRRGVLYQLAREGLIETISIRRKGRARGRRLIVAETLRNYLRGLRDEQCRRRKEVAE